MSKPYVMTFEPTFKHRIWGGSQLQDWFPTCPTHEQIGEAWVLSDHREGESPIANGAYAGKTLHEVMLSEPSWFVSARANQMPDGRFPLLVKVIDAADDLSVQVHPDDTYGYAHAGEQGKTECWWILAADEASHIVYGHHAPDADAFRSSVESGAWSTLLKSVKPHVGDFYFVPSGKLHALGRQTMVLEIQQSSDTTYRVYDYDRTDASGNQRALHLEDAIAVTQYPDQDVPSERSPVTRVGCDAERLVACPYFAVEHWICKDAELQFDALTILSVIRGEGAVSTTDGDKIPVQRGSQLLVPDGVASLHVTGRLELLATTLPQR